MDLQHRRVVERGGRDSGADLLQGLGADVGRRHLPLGPTSAASATVSSPRPAPTSATDMSSLSASSCPQPRHLGSTARKPKPRQQLQPTPTITARKMMAAVLHLFLVICCFLLLPGPSELAASPARLIANDARRPCIRGIRDRTAQSDTALRAEPRRGRLWQRSRATWPLATGC